MANLYQSRSVSIRIYVCVHANGCKRKTERFGFSEKRSIKKILKKVGASFAKLTFRTSLNVDRCRCVEFRITMTDQRLAKRAPATNRIMLIWIFFRYLYNRYMPLHFEIDKFRSPSSNQIRLDYHYRAAAFRDDICVQTDSTNQSDCWNWAIHVGRDGFNVVF